MEPVVLCNYVKPILLKTNEASCNCSMFRIGEKTYLTSREVTYFTCDTCGFVLNGKYHTINHLYEVASHYKLTKHSILSAPFNAGRDFVYNGLEDIRTVFWGGKPYFVCTKVYGNTDSGVMCFGRIVDLQLCELTEIPTGSRREKNWMPVETMPFKCIYSTSPYRLIDLKTKNYSDLYGFKQQFSGSSPVVRYKGNTLISLVHVKDKSCRYTHYLVEYDSNLNPIRISQPFSFFGNRTEFCCCLQVTEFGIDLIPSVNDGASYVFSLPCDLVNSLFCGELTDASKNPRLYDMLYEDAVEINAMEVAATAACLATNPEYIAAAIIYNHSKSVLDFKSRVRRQHILIKRYNTVKHWA